MHSLCSFIGVGAGLALLLTVGRTGDLPAVLLGVAAGPLVTSAGISLVAWMRRRRARRACTGPATADDPAFQADLVRRLEMYEAEAGGTELPQIRYARQWLNLADPGLARTPLD
jgi:hypothetical protein